jgi:hypothetical protein
LKGEKMKRVSFVLIGVALLSAVKAYAYAGHDFQFWNTDVEEFKINKVSKVALEEEFRFGNNAHEFQYHHYDVGFFYSPEKYLSIAGGYRHVYELKKGKFKLENEPYAAASLFCDLARCKLEDRSRLEYRHFDYQADSWRYRNKITVKLPWKFTAMEIYPFFSDEIFVGLSDAVQCNQNRFSSGIGMNLTKNVKTEIYYMLQSVKKSEKWGGTNVAGAKLKITF